MMLNKIVFSLIILSVLLINPSMVQAGEEKLSRNQQALDTIQSQFGDKDNFKFVVVGDTRSYPKRWQRIANLINSLEPDFVFNVGDIAIHGLEEEFDEVMPIFDSIKAPLIAIIGNHDIVKGKDRNRNFRKYFGETEYTFDLKNLRFVLVDNGGGYLANKQIDRIEKDFETDLVRIIMMHAPPKGMYDKHVFEANAKELIDAIIKSGCEYAFFGHIHIYDHKMIGKNCKAYVTGGGGAEIGPPSDPRNLHHVLLVTVKGRDIEVEMVPLEEEE